MADWLPSRERDLVDLCEKWNVILKKADNITLYKWDTDEVGVVLVAIKVFLTARAAYEEADTSANRLAKDEAKENARDAMRDFTNAAIRFNKNIPDAVKLELGLRAKDTVPTAHPRPAGQPETVVENTKNHYEHKVIALNADGRTSGKPDDAYGVKFGWQVGGEKPASGEDLPKSQFSRKPSITIPHTEADKGKPAWYAARYENAKGEGGSWSPIVEAYIG